MMRCVLPMRCPSSIVLATAGDNHSNDANCENHHADGGAPPYGAMYWAMPCRSDGVEDSSRTRISELHGTRRAGDAERNQGRRAIFVERHAARYKTAGS